MGLFIKASPIQPLNLNLNTFKINIKWGRKSLTEKDLENILEKIENPWIVGFRVPDDDPEGSSKRSKLHHRLFGYSKYDGILQSRNNGERFDNVPFYEFARGVYVVDQEIASKIDKFGEDLKINVKCLKLSENKITFGTGKVGKKIWRE